MAEAEKNPEVEKATNLALLKAQANANMHHHVVPTERCGALNVFIEVRPNIGCFTVSRFRGTENKMSSVKFAECLGDKY